MLKIDISQKNHTKYIVGTKVASYMSVRKKIKNFYFLSSAVGWLQDIL